MAPFAYITNYASSSVSVIDTATNTVVATVQLDRQSVGSPSGVAVTPDGKHVYVTAGDHIVAVIDTATNTVVATVDVSSPGAFAPATGGAFAPFGVAVTPDGKRVYVANQSFWCVLPCNFMDIVAVIDTATNTVVATVSLPATTEPFGVAVTPDGKSVYVTGQHSNTVEVIDTATNTDVASVPVIFPQGVAVTPDGKRVYVASGTNVTGTVSVIDTATNTVVTSVPVGIAPYGVAVAPDGARVYVTNEFDNTVSVIDTAMNRVVGSPIPVGSVPRGVAVTPDGARVYVANYGGNGIGNGTVSVIDTATNTVVATVGVGVLPVAFGKFITPGSSILWGVDSLLPATPDLFIALKDQAGAPPAFWGRYIGEHDALSPGEVTLMRNNNCRVLVIFRDTTNGELKTKPKAIAQARAAIRIAQKQMIPSGVWIYADTEFPDQSPTAEWFAGWFETLQGQGSPYGAGVYGNTSNGAVPKFGKAFCDAYPHFPNPAAAYVYTNQAKPGQPKPGCDFKNRNFDPAVLQCNPPTVIQQYALKCAVPGTTRNVDLDLANAAGFASMWKP